MADERSVVALTHSPCPMLCKRGQITGAIAKSWLSQTDPSVDMFLYHTQAMKTTLHCSNILQFWPVMNLHPFVWRL